MCHSCSFYKVLYNSSNLPSCQTQYIQNECTSLTLISLSFQVFNRRSMARHYDGLHRRTSLRPSRPRLQCDHRSDGRSENDMWIQHDLFLLRLIHLPLLIHYAQHRRRCHYGLIWLFNKGFVHFGVSSFEWIYHCLVWIWSLGRVSLWHWLVP